MSSGSDIQYATQREEELQSMSPDSSAWGKGFNKTYSVPEIAKGFDVWQGHHCQRKEELAQARLCNTTSRLAINHKGSSSCPLAPIVFEKNSGDQMYVYGKMCKLLWTKWMSCNVKWLLQYTSLTQAEITLLTSLWHSQGSPQKIVYNCFYRVSSTLHDCT